MRSNNLDALQEMLKPHQVLQEHDQGTAVACQRACAQRCSVVHIYAILLTLNRHMPDVSELQG